MGGPDLGRQAGQSLGVSMAVVRDGPGGQIDRDTLLPVAEVEDGLFSDLKDQQRLVEMDPIDAEGLIVAPGLIDLHVHLREPGREEAETIETGSRAGHQDVPVETVEIVAVTIDE